MDTVSGRNGGVLHPQQPGSPALPGAGRPANPFKAYIRQVSDSGHVCELEMDAFLIVDGGKGEKVRVLVEIPTALAVVQKMFRKAAKHGDVSAARWLSETGFGKTVNLSNDPDNPVGSGFVVVLPSNDRDKQTT